MKREPREIETLRHRVAGIEAWYHRIDLGDGVETPGHFRMSDYLGAYHLPERLDGMRVLDVGASTGFFAYEFERRGAAEVVAIELPTWGITIGRRATGANSARRPIRNVRRSTAR